MSLTICDPQVSQGHKKNVESQEVTSPIKAKNELAEK